jgi:hypothetical protein
MRFLAELVLGTNEFLSAGKGRFEEPRIIVDWTWKSNEAPRG